MMLREIGDRNFALWLLGDSNPKNWQDKLNTPLDPRHPSRHNIWTSVLDVVQDRVFRACRYRVDTSSIYIRNAIENPDTKPRSGDMLWQSVQPDLAELRMLLHTYQPKLLLCFGAFAFEFARRTLLQGPERPYGFWGARELGQEYRRRIDTVNATTTTALPLLHRSISSGWFVQSHEY
jgi:hypothetical protein